MKRLVKLPAISGAGNLRLSQLPETPAIPKSVKAAPKKTATKKKGLTKVKVTAKKVEVVEPVDTGKKWGKK